MRCVALPGKIFHSYGASVYPDVQKCTGGELGRLVGNPVMH